jgi:pimeloyl-ACP methyl ester carboxylesterase
MKPAYFGSSACPLFGIHEPPRAATPRSTAVLLCYPGVQEYNMAHWAFRRLSSTLAKEGFHVLRFDWSGTGDSWGRTADGTMDQWVDDVTLGVQELRDASGAESVSVVGLRLGAAIAAVACAKTPHVEDLVLWEPVICGRHYIAELESLDARENTRLLHRVPPSRDELVGFPFPERVRSAIQKFDLRTSPPRGVKRVAIVVGAESWDARDLERAFNEASLETAFHCTLEDESTTNAGQREAALLASRSLATITEHLVGAVREQGAS